MEKTQLAQWFRALARKLNYEADQQSQDAVCSSLFMTAGVVDDVAESIEKGCDPYTLCRDSIWEDDREETT